jgi:arsenate reductase
MSITIYHNPRCSKSRKTLETLQEKGIKPSVVEYLKNPPNAEQLDTFLTYLNITPRDLMRKGEAEYKDNKLEDNSLTHQQLVEAMIKYPKLIERPIVVVEEAGQTKVAIGRPLENVLEIIK